MEFGASRGAASEVRHCKFHHGSHSAETEQERREWRTAWRLPRAEVLRRPSSFVWQARYVG